MTSCYVKLYYFEHIEQNHLQMIEECLDAARMLSTANINFVETKKAHI